MSAVTEEEAKAFFDRGPDPDVPASLRIDAACPPHINSYKSRGADRWSVAFYFYADAKVRRNSPNGYWRKKHKRVFAAIFDTREEADASKYRAVYNYVMARCPKTSVAVMAERHRAAIELANDPNHHRDQRHAAREARQVANDPDAEAAAKRLKSEAEEAARAARVATQ